MTEMPDLPRIPVAWRWVWATVVSTAVIVAALVAFEYPRLPDPMPVHWNAAGEPDGFRPKSMGAFLGLVLLGPGSLILTMLGSMGLISMQSTSITGMGGAKTPAEAHRTWHGYRIVQGNLGWYLFLLNLAVLFMLARSYGGNTAPFELPLMLALIFALTAALIVRQVRQQKAVEEEYPRPAGERAKWRGIFYHDPEDPRILVDTGSGSNVTFNTGRPAGRVLAGLLFALPALLLLWIGTAALGG